MSRLRRIGLACFLALFLFLLAQASATPPRMRNQASTALPTITAETVRGQKIFQQNCARCHDAPQAFPPQISGTILRHMRVRASLSSGDEKALLHFMNP